MFLPRGAVIAEELEKLAKETEFAAGYQRVRTPHIARESLYQKSGHLPYYAESMFPPMRDVKQKTKRTARVNASLRESKWQGSQENQARCQLVDEEEATMQDASSTLESALSSADFPIATTSKR